VSQSTKRKQSGARTNICDLYQRKTCV